LQRREFDKGLRARLKANGVEEHPTTVGFYNCIKCEKGFSMLWESDKKFFHCIQCKWRADLDEFKKQLVHWKEGRKKQSSKIKLMSDYMEFE
jgi:hypothetical protein